jgi:hypothetical protein
MTVATTNPATLVDWPKVFAYFGYNADEPATQALVLVCDRYGLDPLLGHAYLIETAGRAKTYITRDGMLDVAHRSGMLDGIVVDEQRRNSTDDGWTAFVSVWRKDMSHPFRYGAQCKDREAQARNGYGIEQAVARAERRSLKRAFRIPTSDELAADDRVDFDAIDVEEVREPEPDPAADTYASPPRAQQRTQAQLDTIRRLLAKHDVTSDDEAAPLLSDLAGRPIGPGQDPLTYDEANRVILALGGKQKP